MSHATFQVSRFDPEWTVGLDWMLSTCGLSEVWGVLSCFPSERILVGKGELRDEGTKFEAWVDEWLQGTFGVTGVIAWTRWLQNCDS